MSVKEINDYLNKKSGVLGISGVSSDFRDLESAAAQGNERAELALNIFCYRVKKYIGEYIAVLGGMDVLIFTAGIGENNGVIRQKIVDSLSYIGVKLDPDKNIICGQEMDISTPDARVRTLVVPTNEEIAIARETLKLIR